MYRSSLQRKSPSTLKIQLQLKNKRQNIQVFWDVMSCQRVIGKTAVRISSSAKERFNGHCYQYTFLEQFTKLLKCSYGYHVSMFQNVLQQINLLVPYNMAGLVFSIKGNVLHFSFLFNLKHINIIRICDHSSTFTGQFRSLTCLSQTSHKCQIHFNSDSVTAKRTTPKAMVL